MDLPEASLKYRWCLEGPWKLIVPNRALVTEGQVELFQLIEDPREQNNLADLQPDLVESLQQCIDAYWKVDGLR